MNCKPGDFALIWRSPVPVAFDDLIGRFVTIKSVFTEDGEDICEFTKDEHLIVRATILPRDGGMIYKGDPVCVYTIPDDCLRPIRGLGRSVEKTERAPTPAELEAEFMEWLGVGA